MAIKHPTSDATKARQANRAAKLQQKTLGGGPDPDSVKDGVEYIPSDEFQAVARRVAARRAGLLKRLAE